MRAADLQRLVDRLAVAFGGADLSVGARAALEVVFARLQQPAPEGCGAGETLEVEALLAPALAGLSGQGAALAGLAEALAALAPRLIWTTRKKVGPTASPGFAAAHGNTMLIGPGGLEARDDVWVGLSLMAPHTRYPDHDHAPEEVYLALSDGAFQHGEEDWLPRKAGQSFHNTPGIRHAMRSGQAPFLALWCLPV